MEFTFDIIVPAFNAGSTIGRLLESLTKQKYTGFRLLVVDDGSSDDTGSICKKYALNHVNIIYTQQENQGAGAARKNGFSLARADYVMFFDADDYVEDGIFDMLNNALTETLADVVEFGFRKVLQNGVELSKTPLLNETRYGQCMDHYIFQKSTTNFMWNKAFRRNLITSEDFVNLRYSEDACFLANIFKKARVTKSVRGVYYNYVISPESVCGSKITDSRLDILYADQYIMNLLGAEFNDLIPYEAVTTCAHAAKLYGRFSAAGILDDKNSKILKRHFNDHYPLFSKDKKRYLGKTTIKRKISIMLFRISPWVYAKVLGSEGRKE